MTRSLNKTKCETALFEFRIEAVHFALERQDVGFGVGCVLCVATEDGGGGGGDAT